MERVEEVDLILKRSDEEAVLYIMDEYGEQIKRLIYTYVKNYAQTDDLFQEFLITVYQKIDSFKGNSSLKTWLYRIAINKCKDYLRSPIHRLFTMNGKESQEKEKSAEYFVLKKERLHEIVLGILSLPIKYREIFVLRFYQELSIKEISESLGISESTVRTRIMRGKKKLESILGGERIDEIES